MPDEARTTRVQALLLAALAAGPAHSYALMVALRRGGTGGASVDGGTLYQALRGLEDSGLITGSWVEGPGRRRREYRLTRRGRHSLADAPRRGPVGGGPGVLGLAGVRPSWSPT